MMSELPPHVSEILKKAVKDDIENFDIIFHEKNKKGAGYLGNILFITLRHKRIGKEFDFIIKQAFTDEHTRNTIPVRNAFKNEIFFYTDIFPAFDKFQENIDLEFQFKTVPKCFGSNLNDNCESIILENLKLQGFELHEKKKAFDKIHFEVILREYGKYHGLSFAYKDLHPEKYERLTNNLIDVFADMSKMSFFHRGAKYIYEISLNGLQPGVDDHLIRKFKPYLEDFEKHMDDILLNKTKYTAIIHGDSWSNNMMFKYNELRELTDFRLLDFQALRNVSPCFDVSHCIYSGASKEILENLDYYLYQVYYSSLSATIRQFGCDPEKLYPKEQFKKDFKLHCNFGLTIGLMVWKVKFSYEEELIDFQDGETDIFRSGFDEKSFNVLSKDMLRHFYENDLFISF